MEDLSESYEAASPADANWQEIPPALPPLGILTGLSDQSLANLSTYGQYRQLSAGTQLIREGDAQDCFYVLVSGKLAISAMAAGREVPLSIAEAGECLGEVSLLEPGPASASVQVLEDAVLWSMNLEDMRRYLTEHPGGGGALLLGMAQCLSQRIRQVNYMIGQHHALSAQIYPRSTDRAITAENTPVSLGFFDRIKRSLSGDKKVKISDRIKL